MAISERSQTVLVWWGLVLATIYGIAWFALLRMMLPPDADMTALQVAAWYQERETSIKIGAMVASWTAAFLVPYFAVVGIQISRQEKGRPIWAVMAIIGGAMMSIFLVLPPLFWGTAAFTADRNPEITQIMHQLGCLALTTTDQYYVFNWAAVAVACFLPQIAKHSPFPRWFGYFTAFETVAFEVGALAFNFKTGPFAWNGIIALGLPLVMFTSFMTIMSYLLLKNLKLQRIDAEKGETAAVQTESVGAS